MLYAVSSYYNVATSITLTELLQDTLILAKLQGADVYNILNVVDNEEVLQPLQCHLGDGKLCYYLYNWRCPPMYPHEIGKLLV